LIASGNIRLRADGRWEVRVTIGIDYATGEERRISRYAKTQEEAIKLLHELSFIRSSRGLPICRRRAGEYFPLYLFLF